MTFWLQVQNVGELRTASRRSGKRLRVHSPLEGNLDLGGRNAPLHKMNDFFRDLHSPVVYIFYTATYVFCPA